jgi:hypothetical protein
MRKLLTASLLLTGCTLQPASAQKTTVPHRKVATTKADYSSPAWVPNWVAAEFCEAYSRYFLALPYQYKYSASQALRNTPLADPNANLTSMLAKDVTLREAVYKTIYQFCYSVKYDYDNSQGVDEIVYLMLYQDFHLSNLAATQLTMHINSRYKHAAPPRQPKVSPVDPEVADKSTTGFIDQPATLHPPQVQDEITTLVKAPVSDARILDLQLVGWRFEAAPVIEAEGSERGLIRFKLKVNDEGEVEYVSRVTGNVSSAQEKLCRDKLLDARFVKVSPDARATTGYYTFRFTVK